MSIARHDGRLQVCCDTCPAAYPNTYAAEDFGVMIADARAAGWAIRKLAPQPRNDTSDLFGRPPRIAGNAGRQEPYSHACPVCIAATADRRGTLL
jgi:hypothetical protein